MMKMKWLVVMISLFCFTVAQAQDEKKSAVEGDTELHSICRKGLYDDLLPFVKKKDHRLTSRNGAGQSLLSVSLEHSHFRVACLLLEEVGYDATDSQVEMQLIAIGKNLAAARDEASADEIDMLVMKQSNAITRQLALVESAGKEESELMNAPSDQVLATQADSDGRAFATSNQLLEDRYRMLALAMIRRIKH